MGVASFLLFVRHRALLASGAAQRAPAGSNIPPNENRDPPPHSDPPSVGWLTMKEPTVVSRKVAVLGARLAGKSSLISAFVNGSMHETYDPTIEATYPKTIKFHKVSFVTDIIDTAGMEEHSRLSRNASLGVQGYVLVFSLLSRQSFESVRQINSLLLSTLGNVPDVPRVLVGTMKDAADSRQVQQRDAERLAELWGVPYLECSSKTGEGVADVFHTLLKEIEKDEGLLEQESEGRCCIT